jgi:hypothetical protein
MSEEEIPLSPQDRFAMAVGQVEYRMAELEEQVGVRNGNAAQQN